VIGAVYLLPFLYFLWRGVLSSELKRRLWLIFGLGALQGAVGWWMVASGLAHRVSVSQYRLAFHLTLACVIYAALLWVAGQLRPRAPINVSTRVRASAVVLLALVLVQIYLGALVAGLRAGLIYNTWPLIDGAWIPDASRLFFETPLWRNFFENTLTVQFNHRMAAYVLWLLAVLHAVDVARTTRSATALAGSLVLAGAITLQAALGIVTLLYWTPPALALLHQAMAIVVLTIAVVHAQNLARRPALAGVGERENGTPMRSREQAT
jgi:cytochrome c oxidase assembly protein subunit 15